MNESNREKAELLGKGLFSWEERVAAIEAALEEAEATGALIAACKAAKVIEEAHAAGLAEGEAKHQADCDAIQKCVEQAAEIERLKSVINSDEQQAKQWVKRNLEMQNDVIETAKARDLARQRATAAEAKVDQQIELRDEQFRRAENLQAKVKELQDVIQRGLYAKCDKCDRARREGIEAVLRPVRADMGEVYASRLRRVLLATEKNNE